MSNIRFYKHDYIRLLEKTEENNSTDITFAVQLNKMPISFSSSLYDSLQIPQHIKIIYVSTKVIGHVLVTEKTFYVVDSGVCLLERNRKLITQLLEYVYGPNQIMF